MRFPSASGVAVFYAGLVVGVPFYATSIKFLAPSPSVAELLDVGRQTFAHFVWIEGPLVAALFLGARREGARRLALASAVGVIVAAQHGALRPLLDARVEEIIQGRDPGPSSLHLVYIGLEAGKLALLVLLGASRPPSTTTLPPPPPADTLPPQRSGA